MDSTLKAAWIGAVAGFVVWFFSWLWTLWTDRRARKRIRSMIRIEIDDNLGALRRFLEVVDQRVTFTTSAVATMQRGDALSAVDLPAFSHRIWEVLTPSVPIGLNETEIQKVHRFHAELDELIRLKGISRDPQSQSETSTLSLIRLSRPEIPSADRRHPTNRWTRAAGALNCEFRISNCGFEFAPPRQLKRLSRI